MRNLRHMNDRRTRNRLEKQYRIEYGPLAALLRSSELKTGTLINLSAAGVQFSSDASFPAGAQLFIKIYVTGWRDENGTVRKVDEQHAELLLKTIAEVLRVDADAAAGTYRVAAKFLGQVTTEDAG
jgi:hypothetical protein